MKICINGVFIFGINLLFKQSKYSIYQPNFNKLLSQPTLRREGDA